MPQSSLISSVNLARALIRAPSVTPVDAGVMDLVEAELARLGFTCRRMKFGEIENLYARRGTTSPNLCFAGHTDVVPAGDAGAWKADPFAAEVRDGVLYGRGAVDMKSAIAAFICAVESVLGEGEPAGSLSFLITGDEEGAARDGTRRVVEQLLAEGEVIDHCLVGEPTSAKALGDMLKVGRRGSLNAWIEVTGRQGHVAYPDRASNPIPVLAKLIERLAARRLDEGYPEFQPSNLEFTALEVSESAVNMIPARARARLNIRFNPNHTGAQLVDWLARECAEAEAGFEGKVTLDPSISGEAFYTAPCGFTAGVIAAIRETLGVTAEPSTSGGTSDARFIRDLCPVIEFGLVGSTMHMVDERVPVAEVEALTRTYAAIIRGYFGARER
jgi:succinyl-diaminopimelate desuccinylase